MTLIQTKPNDLILNDLLPLTIDGVLTKELQKLGEIKTKLNLEDLGIHDGVRYVLLLQGLTWIPPPIILIQLSQQIPFGQKTSRVSRGGPTDLLEVYGVKNNFICAKY